MNIFEAIIVGIIFSAIGTFGMLQFKEDIKYEEKYSIVIFIIGVVFQLAMEDSGKGKWYCMDGLFCNVDDNNDIKINNREEGNYDSEINEVIIDEEETYEPFISSMEFGGRKEGYVFKKGDQGMGYYMDNNL